MSGWLLSLCWPEQEAKDQSRAALPGQAAMVEYGVRLGLAGALCAGLGFGLELEHKGWATAACLLVMRPTAEMTRLRGAGRAISVTAGALTAAALALRDAEPAVIALAVAVALTSLAATPPEPLVRHRASRPSCRTPGPKNHAPRRGPGT